MPAKKKQSSAAAVREIRRRAVETLPRDIYRAKGIVRLDLETGD